MGKIKKYDEFIINESFIPVPYLKVGKKYMAQDLNNPGKFEEIEILSIKKDSSNSFDIDIKYNDGKTDKWYLDKNDNVFKNLI